MLFPSKILVATIPKFINNATAAIPIPIPIVPSTPLEMSNLLLKRDQIDKYITQLIRIPAEFTDNSTNITFDADLCHEEFCCDFDFNITVLQTMPGSVI